MKSTTRLMAVCVAFLAGPQGALAEGHTTNASHVASLTGLDRAPAQPAKAKKPSLKKGIKVAQLAAMTGDAGDQTDAAVKGKAKKQRTKIGGAVMYTNYFSALAPSSFDRVYGMSLIAAPRYTIAKGMSLGAQLGVDVELTDSNWTTYNREPMLTDLRLDWMWNAYTIPGAKIRIAVGFGALFPTSKISQARTMIFGLRPVVRFSRGFKLSSGRFFRSLNLSWNSIAIKRFNEYTTTQLDEIQGCGNSNRPECVSADSPRNTNWQFINVLTASLGVHKRVNLSLSFGVINLLRYGSDAQTKKVVSGFEVPVSEADVNHVALTTATLDVTVPVKSWLALSAGISSFHNQLRRDSDGYRVPLFNRFTQFYFVATLPLGGLIETVKSL